MSYTPPYPTNEMLALSDQGLSASQIGRRFGMTRNCVIGRVCRARAKIAAEALAASESAPSALAGTSPALRGEESKPAVHGLSVGGLVAGNEAKRGAYLDGLIWKRSTYLTSLREEGGL